jgi:hypothetical protein
MDILKSAAKGLLGKLEADYFTESQARQLKAQEEAEKGGGWLNQLRAFFQDPNEPEPLKRATQTFRKQMIEGKTPEERGQARAALNNVIKAWRERKKKDVSYPVKSTEFLPEATEE